MSFPRYPEYKSSSTDFIGEVPIHWKLHRLKHCAEVFPSNVDKKSVEGQIPVRLCNYTDVYYNDTIEDGLDFMSATATEDQARRFELQQNDVVFTKDSESSDDIGIAAFVPKRLPGVIYGYHLSIARANGSSAIGPFLKKYFDSQETKSYFDVSANGLTRVGLGQYAVDNAPIVLPSLNEQTQIARFLDHETAKIDALIHEQERLIELLQEKRKAVISHAVTKGLDPDLSMKDSEVEWLGEVPAHWDIVKVRYVARVFNGTTPSKNKFDYWENGETPWVSSGDLNKFQIDDTSTHITQLAVHECNMVFAPVGAVLVGLVGQGKTRGLSAKLNISSTINQNVAAIVPDEAKLSADYLHFVLQHLYPAMRQAGRGGQQAALNCELVSDLTLPKPNTNEQTAIVRYLDKTLSRMQLLTKQSKGQISLLKERRSALISSAVTGKIDVRNWQPPGDESAFGDEVRQAGLEATA